MAQAGQGGTPSVACINLATVPLGAYSFDVLTAALQVWYDRDVVPVWGYPLRLRNLAKGEEPRPDEWQFIYLDDADDAGALGYHDLTKNGQPISKIFVKATQKDGEQVSVTAAHELAEMALDPLATFWGDNQHDGYSYALELCDPVEEDAYLVNGIAMSNFVHPAWFEWFKHPPGTRFDHLGLLKRPFSMTKGGYLIRRKGGKVAEVFGSAAKAKRFAKEDRRGHRSEYRKPRGLIIKPQRRAA